MDLLIIFMLVWIGSISVALAKSRPVEPVIIQVDFADPCYDAPCSITCMHGVSDNERHTCHNGECRHYNGQWEIFSGRCGKVHGSEKTKKVVINCNGFKRKKLECQCPDTQASSGAVNKICKEPGIEA